MAGRIAKLTERITPGSGERVRSRARDGIPRAPRLAVAVGMSFLLWLYVSAVTDPTIAPPSTVYSSVPVELRQIGADVVPQGNPPSVSVRVLSERGAADEDVVAPKAWVDLTGAGPGNEIRSVRVDVPSGVSLVSVTPPQVRVRLEASVERVMPVRAATQGLTQDREIPVEFSPQQVVVTGGSVSVSRITEVVAVFDFEDLPPGARLEATVQARNAKGAAVTNVSISPAQIVVTRPPTSATPTITP